MVPAAVLITTLKNTDSEDGLFTVEQTFTTLDGVSETLTSSEEIMAGEIKVFMEEYDLGDKEDFKRSYEVIAPQKTVTKSVTKYREEEVCE